ncbi:MAG: phosphoglycolate phosphatase [Solirubrobacteraceae bacterium]|nr:phosphoglycolate phosphatase [Solirubrobacteraceae bacterium]
MATTALDTPDAILFDLDGVLVDSRVAFARSVNAALSAHGLAARPDEELHPFIGPPLHSTFELLLAERDEPGLVEACVGAYRERYRERAVDETVVVPGIPELLERLAERVPLVVATSKAAALAEPLLEALGLRRHFSAVTGPSLAVRGEDKAATVGRALRTVPGADRPVMVGDRRYDVIGAAAHGVVCVGVLWGIGSEEELREAGAEAIVRAPQELGELLGA